jgi:hypothetical protein
MDQTDGSKEEKGTEKQNADPPVQKADQVVLRTEHPYQVVAAREDEWPEITYEGTAMSPEEASAVTEAVRTRLVEVK